ncbi:MAG: SAM-dependent methyltransferase [Longimicrobiales bacterium]
MFSFLLSQNTRPEPYSTYTAEALWTDPHVAKQMLALHLDPDGDLASRNHDTIERSVRWLEDRFGLSRGLRILDLGCGPGLYANPLSELGADVTGVDFSVSSLAHARRVSQARGGAGRFLEGNYLDLGLAETFDLVMLIYGDLCALSPSQRRRLLDSIRGWLAPGGHMVFDVFSTTLFDEVAEETRYIFQPQGGFWSPDCHFHFLTRFKYEADALYLDRHAVVEESRSREIFNWIRCYDPETLSRELHESGWEVVEVLGSLAGEDYDPTRQDFAVVARPR